MGGWLSPKGLGLLSSQQSTRRPSNSPISHLQMVRQDGADGGALLAARLHQQAAAIRHCAHVRDTSAPGVVPEACTTSRRTPNKNHSRSRNDPLTGPSLPGRGKRQASDGSLLRTVVSNAESLLMLLKICSKGNRVRLQVWYAVAFWAVYDGTRF